MKQARIYRLYTGPEGTFGRFVTDGTVLFSGELPWRENKANVSCIPVGNYVCRWTYSQRFKRFMYLVDGVSGRTGIRFHSANFMGDVNDGCKSQLNGCIALGEKLGTMNKQKALLLSKPAIRRFEEAMGKETFKLQIVEDFRD
jgi:hypothetical protein